MKKLLIGFSGLLIIIIFVITYNASFSASYRDPKVNGFELGIITNENHSDENMSLAEDALLSNFKERFNGCKLLKISYSSEEDKYLNKVYKEEPFDEIIVLEAKFKTDGEQEVLDLNKVYDNYKFVIARKTPTSSFVVIDKYE